MAYQTNETPKTDDKRALKGEFLYSCARADQGDFIQQTVVNLQSTLARGTPAQEVFTSFIDEAVDLAAVNYDAANKYINIGFGFSIGKTKNFAACMQALQERLPDLYKTEPEEEYHEGFVNTVKMMISRASEHCENAERKSVTYALSSLFGKKAEERQLEAFAIGVRAIEAVKDLVQEIPDEDKHVTARIAYTVREASRGFFAKMDKRLENFAPSPHHS